MELKIGFLYPGQGSQYVGMMQDWYETFPRAAEILDQAGEILGFPLKDICFEGPEEKLKQTYITQPAIFVHSYIVTEFLAERHLHPNVVAGHSLGEYSALVAAGVLDFADALRLVKLRGEAMQEAGEANPGTMAAIIGLEAEQVKQLCEQASAKGVVQPANFNSPEQIVISGSVEGVHAAMELAREQGARRVVELVVGGAFHSPLMEPAREKLKAALDETPFRDARIPVFTNVNAQPETRGSALKELLELQLIRPVRWVEIIAGMLEDGVNAFYEVGPGKVLTGLVRRISRDVRPTPIDKVAELEKAVTPQT